MKFFLDTEFHEYKKKPLFGKPIDTIELISIGIVKEGFSTEDSSYYAICKDFNLKEAWNSFQYEKQTMFEKQNGFKGRKVYWLRDNVLKPIWIELSIIKDPKFKNDINMIWDNLSNRERYIRMKLLLALYGKSKEQIANEIKDFVSNKRRLCGGNLNVELGFSQEARSSFEGRMECIKHNYGNVEFYAYYADYDWVLFCWLFGRMSDLPKGFPMYAFDIQQKIDSENIDKDQLLKEVPQVNCHNALEDAIWNKKAYTWLEFQKL